MVNVRTCRNRTITRELETAAEGGDLAGVQSELRVATCHIDAVNGDGRTALDMASERGRLEVVIFLVSQGASLTTRNRAGSTALHMPSERGHMEVVIFLVSQGASLNAQCNFGVTPLHYACSMGREDVALMLIERGANVTEKGLYSSGLGT